jgi:hypothetical protein
MIILHFKLIEINIILTMIKLTRTYYKRFSQLKAAEYLKNVEGFKLISTNYSDDFKINVNELVH